MVCPDKFLCFCFSKHMLTVCGRVQHVNQTKVLTLNTSCVFCALDVHFLKIRTQQITQLTVKSDSVGRERSRQWKRWSLS